MAAGRNYLAKSHTRQAKVRNAVVSARISQRQRHARRTTTGHRNVQLPFAPPENWHESTGSEGYQILVQPPGQGYRHVVTVKQVRERLAEVPEHFLRDLEVVQLSQMTKKKQSFPCYGMQWGTALYLYPLEESLVEHFYCPPRPNLINEVKMYGGRWDHPSPGHWTLIWSEAAAQDFYLNNILIHELGHLIDDRNSSYIDRERYAEWFAIKFGYFPTGGVDSRRPRRAILRRHHGC